MGKTILRRGLLGVVAMTSAFGVMSNSLACEPEFTVLHTFEVANAMSGVSATGSQPYTLPVLGVQGDIFGMTYTGGVNGTGVVYRYDPYSGEYQVLHAFGTLDTSSNPNGVNADGAYPGVGLTRGPDDTFYGMASNGGANGNGTIFSITGKGTFKVLHTFGALDSSNHNEDGANPLRALVVGHDGRVYGTTRVGGQAGLGVAFVIGRNGGFTVLHQYTSDEGHAASLTLGYDGYLYGCAVYPTPALGSGLLYRMLPTGQAFEILHRFQPIDAAGMNQDGAECYEPLVERHPGEFVGTMTYGGSGASGIVFRYTGHDGVEVLHNFSGTDSNGFNADGASPQALVTVGRDGALYSTASDGGAYGGGTVYRISRHGKFEVLHTFSATNKTDGSNKDGYEADFGVIWDYRGDLVGMTDYGGLGSAALGYGNGTLYRLNPRSKED